MWPSKMWLTTALHSSTTTVVLCCSLLLLTAHTGTFTSISNAQVNGPLNAKDRVVKQNVVIYCGFFSPHSYWLYSSSYNKTTTLGFNGRAAAASLSKAAWFLFLRGPLGYYFRGGEWAPPTSALCPLNGSIKHTTTHTMYFKPAVKAGAYMNRLFALHLNVQLKAVGLCCSWGPIL